MAGLRKLVLPDQCDQPEWEDAVDYLGGPTTDPQIDATKILLSQGGALLSTWRKSTDLDKIDGAAISAATIPNTALASMTSAQLAGILSDETGTAGNAVFSSSPTIVTPTIASFVNATHAHQAAASGGTLDHGLALTGLADDDHTQYVLRSLFTERGDIAYRNATIWAALPHGADTTRFLRTGGHDADPSWEVPDHGSLGGLSDDDHTQYTLKATLTEQGDIYYASAASTPAALAHGTAGQFLRTGGDSANPAWSTTIWPNAVARGDLLYGNPANTLAARTIGAVGKFLRSDGTDPQWTTMTIPDTVAAGSILAANALNTLSAVTEAAALKVLQNNAGTISWVATTGTDSAVLASSPTIVTPTIASFVNATHTHQAAASGGTLDAAAIAAGTLPVESGGTGTATEFTPGSVVYAGASGVYSQDNADLFWDNTNKRLGIGSTTPSCPLTMYSTSLNRMVNVVVDGPQVGYINVANYYTGISAGGIFQGQFARGTMASPLDVVAGDRLGTHTFAGYAGGDFRNAASVEAYVGAGTISETSLPGCLAFKTAPDGSVTRVERMRIDSAGKVWIYSSDLDMGTHSILNASLTTPTIASFVNANHTHQAAASGGTLDHGLALTGLTDDDHTQYALKATLTEQGDIYYASGAATPAALAHGTDTTYFLRTGGHGANPSWAVPDHGSIGGLGDDDHTQYLDTARHDTVTRHVVTSGGTGTATAFTPGSIVYAGADGVYSEDNANLFWDATNKRLGIGTTAPARAIHVQSNNAVLRLDRDVDSATFMLVRTASGDFTTIWKTFMMYVTATGVNTGTFKIGDLGAAVSGSSAARLAIDNTGQVSLGPGTNTGAIPTGLRVTGGISLPINSQSASYTALGSDFTILMTTGSSADQTITLPPATQTGQLIFCKKVDSGTKKMIISRAGSDTIEGVTTISTTVQYACALLVADGTSTWYKVTTTGTFT